MSTKNHQLREEPPAANIRALQARLRRLEADRKRLKAESREGSKLQQTVHELEVHQEEIRIQNLQLIESQRLLEESRDRYADLYDFAPVAYVALDVNGVIREINLTGASLMGVARGRLIDTPFMMFVQPEH